jgi:membrane-associated phospholipid phosphatase
MRSLDLVTLTYAACGLGVLTLTRPKHWVVLSLAHLATIGLISWLTSAPGRKREWLREWYPLLLIPFFYAEIPLLNAPFLSTARDESIHTFEIAVFPLQPARTLAAAFPWRVVSESLHFAYLAYYPIIYGPLVVLYRRGERDAFRETACAVMITYCCCYLTYVFLPVRGPWDLLPISQAPPDGPLRRLVVDILKAGSSAGAAFPSSHQAVATTQTICAIRHLPEFAPAIALLSVGIGVGAIYGAFHYAIDILAGAATGIVVTVATRRIFNRPIEYEAAGVISSREGRGSPSQEQL